MTVRLLVKALLATLLMPGVVVGLIPYWILRSTGSLAWPAFSFLTLLSIAIGLAGLTLLVHAVSGFAAHGKGTLAPVDPPKVLVLHGFYRLTRNPMYVAVVCILVAEAILFWSIALLLYAVAMFIVFHLFVLFYEEPHLRNQFGRSYEEYCRSVPRWPRLFGRRPRDVDRFLP